VRELVHERAHLPVGRCRPDDDVPPLRVAPTGWPGLRQPTDLDAVAERLREGCVAARSGACGCCPGSAAPARWTASTSGRRGRRTRISCSLTRSTLGRSTSRACCAATARRSRRRCWSNRTSSMTCATQFGTRMAAAGVPMRTSQEWMGHKDISTTQRYADYAPSTREAEMVAAAFARSPQAVGGASSGHEPAGSPPPPHPWADSRSLLPVAAGERRNLAFKFENPLLSRTSVGGHQPVISPRRAFRPNREDHHRHDERHAEHEDGVAGVERRQPLEQLGATPEHDG
jgi:Phage integrase family